MIFKRPLSFVGPADGYMLRNGQHGSGDWHLVGADEDQLRNFNRRSHVPLPCIQDYMTYDEIKLAAFLQVSSPVQPINSGSRDNIGREGHGWPHVKEAIYVGAVGARFEQPGYMEWQEIVIDSEAKS